MAGIERLTWLDKIGLTHYMGGLLCGPKRNGFAEYVQWTASEVPTCLWCLASRYFKYPRHG